MKHFCNSKNCKGVFLPLIKENKIHSRKSDDITTQLQESKRRISGMKAIGRALSSVLDLNTLLTKILTEVTQIMDAERSSLFLLEEDRLHLSSKIAQGTDKPIVLNIGQGIAGSVAQSGQTINIPDAYKDLRFNPAFDHATGFITRSILCMPIVNVHGTIIGVVQTLNKKKGVFTEEDEALLESLNSQISIALENAKLYSNVVSKNEQLIETHNQLQRRVAELDLLYSIETELRQNEALADIIKTIIQKGRDIIPCELGIIFLQQDKTLFSLSQKNDTIVQQNIEPSQIELLSRVSRTGLSEMYNQEDDNLKNLQISTTVIQCLCVPIKQQDKFFGSFALINRDSQYFSEDDQRMLTLIAGQASRAIAHYQYELEKEKEERLNVIGQMLSGVIHDFKTPMTIITGYIELLKMTEEENERNEQADQVLHQIEVMNQMTRGILAFARGESTTFIQKVMVKKFMSDMFFYIVKMTENKNVTPTMSVGYEGIAYFDQHQMLRMFSNLTKNAIEAMNIVKYQGSIHFSVEKDSEKNSIVFRLKDNGPGIPKSIRQRLFEPFVTQGKKDGTGLGLSIVKKVVENHQATITFDCPQSGGTEFIITLPLRDGQ